MPRVSSEHREARRQQILAAARACFARRGFHQTTMQDICRASSLSPGAVYRYFPAKDDIIEALCAEHSDETSALFAELSARDSWWEMLGSLEAAIAPLLTGADDQKDLALDIEVWGEALRNPRAGDAVRRTLAEQRLLVERLVRHAIARGELAPDSDAGVVARVAVAMLSGLMLQRALEPAADIRPVLALCRRLLAGLAGSADDSEGQVEADSVRAHSAVAPLTARHSSEDYHHERPRR